MADTKISALPASTTPLAGTEVLPIVQSGVTRQVSVADLTAGRALSATQLTLTTGNLIVSNGKGIDFSATPGTGTSELFSDYEEGSFTPAYGTDGSAPTITYLVQVGNYVKIGRMVYFAIELTTTARTGGSGSLRITGLPFTAGATRYTGGYYAGYWDNWTTNAPVAGTIVAGNTFCYMYLNTTLTSTGATISNLTNGTVYLTAIGSYMV